MRGGKSVFQAVRAAGIFRHVATDAANRLRRRIGRVEILLWLDAAGHIEIDDSGLDHHAGVGNVNFQNAIHARKAENDAVFHRKRTAT